MKTKKRTDVNFDEHELTVLIDTPEVLIHKFAKPNTGHESITFINAQGILSITGDYGNWVLCREFIPSADGFVSDDYWCEKLRIFSTQKVDDYDTDETRKEINERLKNEDEYLDGKDKRYLKDLLDNLDEDEDEYKVYAYNNLPPDRDFEFIPFAKKLNPELNVIFDAFDEMCRRINEANREKV